MTEAFDAFMMGEPGQERDRQYGRMVCMVTIGRMREHREMIDACAEFYTERSPADADALEEGIQEMKAEWEARAAQQ